VHRSQDPRVVIIEYDVHGKTVATAPHTTTGSSRSLPSRAERSCNGGTIWTRWQP
jgi:hypothetical protein